MRLTRYRKSLVRASLFAEPRPRPAVHCETRHVFVSVIIESRWNARRWRRTSLPCGVRSGGFGGDLWRRSNWRVIVVGGHTRSIGKTQLVCDMIAAFPEANWIAGKITQYGHGVCAQNGRELRLRSRRTYLRDRVGRSSATSGTDSARFLAAGAKRSFWLRTKQGFLAEGMPLLREGDSRIVGCSSWRRRHLPHVILESNSLLQFLKPSLYLMVVHPAKADFKESAQLRIDRVSAFVLREPLSHRACKPDRGRRLAESESSISYGQAPISSTRRRALTFWPHRTCPHTTS